MKTIRNKTPHSSGYEGWNVELSDGSNWSVLNFADSMKNHPYPEGIYLGWEALSNKGEIIRARDGETLLKLICE